MKIANIYTMNGVRFLGAVSKFSVYINIHENGPSIELITKHLNFVRIKSTSKRMKYSVESILNKTTNYVLRIACEQLRAQFPPHEKLDS